MTAEHSHYGYGYGKPRYSQVTAVRGTARPAHFARRRQPPQALDGLGRPNIKAKRLQGNPLRACPEIEITDTPAFPSPMADFH
jgi:hypothetical protein